MVKLTKEHKQNWKNWLDALLSGKYVQGKRKLHDVKKNCFCCLGVACDLLDQPFNIVDGTYGLKKFYVGVDDLNDARFSDQIVSRKWFLDKFGFLPFYKTHEDVCLVVLAELNDEGTSFSEIVSMLEEELKEHTDYYEVD
jgi:hypothetical protein